MKAREIRAQARQDLTGKWGKMILQNVLYFLCIFVVGLIGGFLSFWAESLSFVFEILIMIVMVPLSYGYLKNSLKIKQDDNAKATEFIKIGFSNFERAWALVYRTMLKMLKIMLLWLVGYIGGVVLMVFGFISLVSSTSGIILVIAGIVLVCISTVAMMIKALLYEFAMYVGVYEEDKSAKEAVEKSAKLMYGNRLNYIWLELSFIGWIILAIIPLGLGLLFLAPYMQFALFAFYESLDSQKVEIVGKDETKSVNPIQE